MDIEDYSSRLNTIDWKCYKTAFGKATNSVRCASRALAQKSSSLCDAGLIALLLNIDPDNDRKDPRDLVVSFAPLHVAAQNRAYSTAALFEQYAEFAPNHVSETLRIFGGRTDVALKAFGWTLAQSKPIQWIVLAA